MTLEPSHRLDHAQEYYFSRKTRELGALRARGVDVINLGIGNPDLPPPPQMQRALAEAALRPTGHGYQGYTGIDALREAMAGWYSKLFDVELDPQREVLPLIGSKEGIMHLSMALLNPGDRVLIPDPGYPTYQAATHLAGGVPVAYPLVEEQGFLPNLHALEAQDLSRVRMMWVNYPHMPTGAAGHAQLFEQLVAFGQRHGILICHDNPYCFIQNPSPMSILSARGAKGVAVELNSLSKSYNMAGWRVGMMVGHPQALAHALRFKSNMDSGMPLAVQQAAIAALGLGSDWFEALNQHYTPRRRMALELAKALGCRLAHGSSSGMFLWIRIPDAARDAEWFSDALLGQTGVFITPGSVFGGQGARYLRISLCAHLNRLTEACQRASTFASTTLRLEHP